MLENNLEMNSTDVIENTWRETCYAVTKIGNVMIMRRDHFNNSFTIALQDERSRAMRMNLFWHCVPGTVWWSQNERVTTKEQTELRAQTIDLFVLQLLIK